MQDRGRLSAERFCMTFPGLDPYLEGQLWEGFHTAFITGLGMWLAPHLGEEYFVSVEHRVYVERKSAGRRWFQPDISGEVTALPAARSTKWAGGPKPTMVPLAMPVEVREPYLTVRARGTQQVVTTIELLSPTNKIAGTDGHGEYVRKRETVLASHTHLVEIDLLRGGERLPMASEMPEGDYYGIVSRASQRPLAEVYAWMLRDPMPTLPLPLAGDDEDAPLELQGAYEEVYGRFRYNRGLDYSKKLRPPLSEAGAAWVAAILRG